ncbi:hypothetical protein INT47_003138 [Mucor saturninus]|uniref:Uncharacterized protein n=1 Tax=Mucor saturninus TaxID=64648 RepID=A0A8H7QLE0_9FUNG|nr:hypothetical protein INT47_003138 [Mucor saturninus]
MMVPRTVRNPPSAPYTTPSNPEAIAKNILSPASSNSVFNSGNTICSILDKNKCVQELKSIPTNCYLYQILPTAIRGGSGEVMGKINYIMARVVIPTTGFIYPITYVQPKFNPIASMIDTILEKLSPTTKMMICSVEPQTMTKAQMMMDLLKRVAQFKKPTVSYTLNATVQCVYSKEGRQNLVSIIYTAEPTQNEPIQEEPVQTQPAVEPLVQAQPAQAQPAQAQPAQEVQPTQGETSQAQPTQEEPVQAQPAQAQTVQAQPTQIQPAVQPAQVQPAQVQPAQVQPAQAESAHREPKVILQQPQSNAGEPSHRRITQGTQTQFTQPRSTQNQSTGSPVIRDQAIRDRITGIKFNRARTTRNQAAIERFSRDRAIRDQAIRDQTTRDQAIRDQATRDKATRDQATRDQAARDQAARDRAIRDRAIRDQAIRDQTTRDQAIRDQAARDQATRDQAVRDQAARDIAIRDQAARDQIARERILRDQTAREQISRGQTTRDQTTKGQTTRDQVTRDRSTRDQTTRNQPLGDQATNRDRTTQRQPTRSKSVLHPVFPVTQEQYYAALEFEKEADYPRSDPVVFSDTEEELLTEPDKYGKAEKLLRDALKEAEKIIDADLDTRFPTEQVQDEHYETISLKELYRKKQLAEEAASVWKEPPPFVPLDVNRYEIPGASRGQKGKQKAEKGQTSKP